MLNRATYSEEELRHYNPAYTGCLLYASLYEFSQMKQAGMDLAFPFLILPLSMNKNVSESLPRSVRTPIESWVYENGESVAMLHHQAEAFVPVVKAGLSFLLDRDVISVSSSGLISKGSKSISRQPSFFKKSTDMQRALRTSKLLGRWFSQASSVEIVFVIFGIRP